jgi:predicted amidohydrolase YtcJ
MAVPHRFPALIADPAPAEGRLWLTGARLLDGTGGPVRDRAAVLVQDGVIRRVGSAAEPCPDGARLLDLGQRTLMPALIDAHTHLAGRPPATLRGAEEALPGTAAHFLQAGLRACLRRASPRSGSPGPRGSGRRRPARRCVTAQSGGPGC